MRRDSSCGGAAGGWKVHRFCCWGWRLPCAVVVLLLLLLLLLLPPPPAADAAACSCCRGERCSSSAVGCGASYWQTMVPNCKCKGSAATPGWLPFCCWYS